MEYWKDFYLKRNIPLTGIFLMDDGVALQKNSL
jgi:hypothetical protein